METWEMAVALVLLVFALFVDVLIARWYAGTKGPRVARDLILQDKEYQETRAVIKRLDAAAADTSQETFMKRLDEMEAKLSPAKAKDFREMAEAEMREARRSIVDKSVSHLRSKIDDEMPEVMKSIKASVRNYANDHLKRKTDEMTEEAEDMLEAIGAGAGGDAGVEGLAETVTELFGPPAGALVRGGNKFFSSPRGKVVLDEAKAMARGVIKGEKGAPGYAGPPPGG